MPSCVYGTLGPLQNKCKSLHPFYSGFIVRGGDFVTRRDQEKTLDEPGGPSTVPDIPTSFCVGPYVIFHIGQQRNNPLLPTGDVVVSVRVKKFIYMTFVRTSKFS
jgi:hypothetical protein